MEALENISIVVPREAGDFVRRVADILEEELRLRAGVEAKRADSAVSGGYSFLLGEAEALARAGCDLKALNALETPGAEGFRLAFADGLCTIAGADGRGCLYGMAHVLRKLWLRPGEARLTAECRNLSLTPTYALRGHQLAYRDKQNTHPAWDVEDFDRYIRDLALFGSNAIEILPPRTDDRLWSPLFPREPLDMMARLSEIIHSYGMDVWVWYPNMGENYDDPAQRRAELEERERVYSALPYVDAVLIPAGDPGELEPKALFPVVAESCRVLHSYHPKATVWIAPQVFAPSMTWHEDFYQELSREPDWLYGVCYAPWMQETLPEFHARVPEKYKSRIRHYPDITHNSSSQFEMPDWDLPFALFNGRESYNARPRAMKHIHNMHAPYTVGSLTYCEGIHDDVNKVVWGDQDFCPGRDPAETLRDYVRLFIDPALVDELAPLLLAFEDSWVGPAAQNEGIDRVFQAFEALSERVDARIRDNFRFKMAHLRALTDYQAKHRYLRDQALERDAYALLAKAGELGADEAMQAALDTLNLSVTEPVNDHLNMRMLRLAQELFETPGCRMQLSTKYQGGQSWIRGSYLDNLRMPLGDHQYLSQHFRRIRRLSTEAEKQAAIEALCSRTDPGDDGLYICLGDPASFHKYVRSAHSWEEDPGFLRSPVVASDPYGIQMVLHRNRGWHDEFPIAMNWIRRVRVLYGTPLCVHFDGLSAEKRYTLRVTYPDAITARYEGTLTREVKLYAGGRLVHDRISCFPAAHSEPVYEYLLPKEATASGELDLIWQAYGVLDSFSVSEIWLMPEKSGGREGAAS